LSCATQWTWSIDKILFPIFFSFLVCSFFGQQLDSHCCSAVVNQNGNLFSQAKNFLLVRVMTRVLPAKELVWLIFVGGICGRFYFDFSMTYIGVGMICPHIVNCSVLLGAIISWGIMWPLISAQEGKWFPANLPSSDFGGLYGYKVCCIIITLCILFLPTTLLPCWPWSSLTCNIIH
jgi:uncharacterized oligopeptide transporter (OPT) family protein